jgi:O-antigen ligase
LGGAAGTSTPSFLAHLTKKQVGAENEYIRLGLELGIVGLLLWLAFLFWYFLRRRSFPSAEWRLGCSLMYFYSAICWATAFIGTGILTSIPGTMLLLIQMGCVSRSAVGSPAAPPVPATRVTERHRQHVSA